MQRYAYALPAEQELTARPRKIIRLTSFRLILLGFAGLILAGALLLMLPVSVRSGNMVTFSDALFTSVSAVCVTGLVVRDTASFWTPFGQAVLLLLIQIGGLGVVTFAVAIAQMSGRKVSLRQRTTMQEAVSAPQLGGMVPLTGMILRGTLLIEGVGALLLLPVFLPAYGLRGIWAAVFHAVSAFCNAGFDILGTPESPFVSLTGYAADPLLCGTVMLLIITGGLGFLTWEDLRRNGLHIHRYHMQTKVILAAAALLILLPALFFFLTDLRDAPAGTRLLEALFQSVTARTAGFNTVDLTSMRSGSLAVLIVLMLIGGAPGSTAGGMKITTFVILLANMAAVLFHREDAQLFGRRVDRKTIRTASALFGIYLFLFAGGALLISTAEQLPLDECLFETASAIGTVGLSLSLTPTLGAFSRAVLMFLMFFGRVGGLTMFYAAISAGDHRSSHLPVETISVG
jgi:trk system potassium uptake protein TrkH